MVTTGKSALTFFFFKLPVITWLCESVTPTQTRRMVSCHAHRAEERSGAGCAAGRGPRARPVSSGRAGLAAAVPLASPRNPSPAQQPGTWRVLAGQPGALGAAGKGGLCCLSLPASPEEDFLRAPHF